MGAWVIGGIALLCVVAAFMRFLQTPKHLRYRAFSGRIPIEERVTWFAPSAGAVVIRAQRKRVFLRTVVVLVPFVLISAPLLMLKFRDPAIEAACYRVWDLNVVYFSLLSVGYGLELYMFVGTLFLAWLGVRGLRGGYFPPLDAALYQDRIAVRGWRAITWSICCMLSVVLGGYGLYNGHRLFQGITGGESMERAVAKIEQACPSRSGAIAAPRSKL